MTAPRDVSVVAEGFSFLEAPRWRGGRLYASDFYTHRVLAFGADGSVETICTVPGQPSGLGFDPAGRLLIVSMTDRRLLRLDGGQTTEVAELALAPGDCNDMVVDTRGRAYVGNVGTEPDSICTTNLLLVDEDGSVSVAAEDLVFPNGAVITPDGRTFLVAETFAGRITAFDVAPDGTLLDRRLWADLTSSPIGGTVAEAVASRNPLPDGMALDEEGALWIGDANGAGALRIAEGGDVIDVVPTGELAVFAAALGGDNGKTLFMCASPPLLANDPEVDHRASLLACTVDVAHAGLP